MNVPERIMMATLCLGLMAFAAWRLMRDAVPAQPTNVERFWITAATLSFFGLYVVVAIKLLSL